MTVKSNAQLITDIGTDFANNDDRLITEETVRGHLTDVQNSLGNYGFASIVAGAVSQSFNTTFSVVTGWVFRSQDGLTNVANGFVVPCAGAYRIKARIHGTAQNTHLYELGISVNTVMDTTVRDTCPVASDTLILMDIDAILVLANGASIKVEAKSNQGGGSNITVVNGLFLVERVK